jgi:hypothetical protein
VTPLGTAAELLAALLTGKQSELPLARVRVLSLSLSVDLQGSLGEKTRRDEKRRVDFNHSRESHGFI